MVWDYVWELIGGKEVYIKIEKDKMGKYGWYIVDVFFEDVGEWINFNDYLFVIGFVEFYN